MSRIVGLLSLVALSTASVVACNSSSADDSAQEGAFTKVDPRDAGADGDAGDSSVAVTDKGFPQSTSVNGYSFGGCEYWPYKVEGSPYPDHIQWGCQSGSAPAQKCMALSMVALAKILQDPPAKLKEFSTKHRITSFFNWNNDMTDAPADRGDRKPYLWIYRNNLIKWMSTTNRDGTCIIPTRSDLEKLATECMDDLGCRVYDETGADPP
jgi:hypothetical protein